MFTGIYLDNRRVCEMPAMCAVQDIYDVLHTQMGLHPAAFYLHQHGRIASPDGRLADTSDVHVAMRLLGGKGGFGSMLRAIGAQIEKTTNREACRDLSGRRLRDINEEKRLKNWLDGQKERDAQTELRRKQKLEKLQAKPKHVFEDKHYEQSRQEMTQNVADSVEEGLRKAAATAAEAKKAAAASEDAAGGGGVASGSGVKRKATVAGKNVNKNGKKKKTALWLGGDFSSASEDSDDGSDSAESAPQSKSDAAPKTKSIETAV